MSIDPGGRTPYYMVNQVGSQFQVNRDQLNKVVRMLRESSRCQSVVDKMISTLPEYKRLSKDIDRATYTWANHLPNEDEKLTEKHRQSIEDAHKALGEFRSSIYQGTTAGQSSSQSSSSGGSSASTYKKAFQRRNVLYHLVRQIDKYRTLAEIRQSERTEQQDKDIKRLTKEYDRLKKTFLDTDIKNSCRLVFI